jgi:CubicO group peptidase (beta-lactamase class C family)
MGGLWTNVHDLALWVSWLDSAYREPHQPDAIGLSASSRREMQRMHTYVGVTELAGGRYPGGYGFGLRMLDVPELGMVVAHSGGVPGYGSNMRWVAGTGVAAIALANTTYAPMGLLTMQQLQAVHEHEGISRPTSNVSRELADAAGRLLALLNLWNDRTAAELFTDNVALDESLERRAAQAESALDQHGPLELVAIHPDSNTSGDMEVRGTGEPFRVRIELGPMIPPRVQAYYFPD